MTYISGSPSIRVLLIEDNPDDAVLLQAGLADAGVTGFELTWVELLSSGLEHLKAHPVDVVLLDLSLPDSDGEQTFERVRSVAPDVPVVVLTGLDDQDVATDLIKQGAQDYLTKGQVDGHLLSRSLRYAIERKRFQDEIERERRRLEVVLDTSPVGMIVFDANGQVIFANPEIHRILGAPPDSLGNLDDYFRVTTMYRFDGSRYSDEERPNWRALRKREQVLAEEAVYELQDGRRTPVIVNAMPIASDAASDVVGISGIVVAVQDMTALEQAQKARSEFLSMISHEMRTPLTIIKGAAMTYLESGTPLDTSDVVELFGDINAESDRLKDLVENLLEVNQIEAGALSINARSVRVADLMNEAMDRFKRSGAGNPLELVVPDVPLYVMADPQRIVQVMINLLNNAAGFSPKGAPIVIRVERNLEEALVRVEDNGYGIPKEKLPQLFRKFSRLHLDRQGTPRGSGLGLAICKCIVEAHGGRIWAESPGVGRGSTFLFTLPAVYERQKMARADSAEVEQHVYPAAQPEGQARILVVDDEARILALLRRALTRAGFKAIVTTDPTEATGLLDLEKPDLVLLDIMFPETNGFELLGEIRRFSSVPVIFLTASDSYDNRRLAQEMGADGYITKPFSLEELTTRIETTLRQLGASR